MINNDAYCSMIHAGLSIILRPTSTVASQCCLRPLSIPIHDDNNFWNNPDFIIRRRQNLTGVWDVECNNCYNLEQSGESSMRNGMNQGLGIYGQTNLPGPSRIDLSFDNSCNLACRTCGPASSTFWQKQLNQRVLVNRSGQDAISVLSKFDLSNLRQLVFSGGETLLGQEYWTVAEWLANNVPNAKNQLTLCFQTNGTQEILPRNYKTIEKVHLVKLHISIDGIKERFEYLRWPANWNQTIENILTIRESTPSNVMFVVEETISIFNALYLHELNDWASKNFSMNREGDRINHTKHLAWGHYSLDSMTHEYLEKIGQTPYTHLIPNNWTEDSHKITQMIAEIRRFDQQRNQSFFETFPEVAECYRRFI